MACNIFCSKISFTCYDKTAFSGFHVIIMHEEHVEGAPPAQDNFFLTIPSMSEAIFTYILTIHPGAY